MAKDSKLKLF